MEDVDTNEQRGSRVRVTVRELGTHASSGSARSLRVETSTGRATTVHVACWPMATHRVEVVELTPPRPLEQACAERGWTEAINGAFFTKPRMEPLGELWLGGVQRPSKPFRNPWATRRGAMQVAADGTVTIGPRGELDATPSGALLQGAPLLVLDGQHAVADHDPEGLSTTRDEFDSDISAEALPRSVIALTRDSLLGVCVDGRSEEDDGLLFGELAALLIELGAVAALNLDGGSSASLVTDGVRRNTPRDDTGSVLEDGYPTPTALVVSAREQR